MTDIAPLGFFVDTAGLVSGARAIDDFTVKVGKAGDSTDRLSAKAGSATAALGATANGFRQAGNEAERAAQKTDKLGQSAGTATGAFQNFLQRLVAARQGMSGAGEEAHGLLGRLGQLNAIMVNAQQGAGTMAQALGVGPGLTGALGGVTGAAGSAGRAIMTVGSVLGPVGIAVGTAAAAFAGLTVTLSDNQDRWNQYRQRLGVALDDMQAAVASVERLAAIADETGSSMDAIMRSFQRFATIRNEIGATVEELELMTKAIVQLGNLSGTSQGEMQGAMLQFSQALAAGRLNGDELRSIMESMQPLMREIAKGMGVSVGEMRKLGAEGELTSDKIFTALMSRIDEIDAMSQSIDGTTERAQQRMANQLDRMLANMGELIQASQTMQSVYGGIADILATINGLLAEGGDNAEALSKRAAMQVNAARWSATNIPVVGGLIGLAFNYAAGESLEAARNASRDEGGPINQMKELSALQESIRKNVGTLTAEYAKQYEQLKKIQTTQNDIAARRKQISELAAMGRSELQAAQAELEARRSTIMVLEFKALAGDQAAKDALDKARERLETAQIALESIDKSNMLLGLVEREVNQRAADLADGGVGKLRRETERLRDAMLQGGGGLVQVYTQVAEMAERAAASGDRSTFNYDDAVSAVLDQRRAQAENKIADMRYSASLQGRMADRLFAGENKVLVEAETEAMTWAFGQFGTAIKDNMEVVNAYTQTLIQMRLEQQRAADAAELAAIEREIRSKEAAIAVVGQGGYAERLAAFEAAQASKRLERGDMRRAYAGAAGATATATTGAVVPSLADLIATVRWLESRNRDYRPDGTPMRSRAGALFSMQVMPDTARNPGYGIAPARSVTPAEYNRVGEQLLEALSRKYRGDTARILAAYHSGPGNLEAAIRQYGGNWISGLGPEGRAYVTEGVRRLGGGSVGLTSGESFDPAKFDEATGKIFSAEERKFLLDEQLRALQEIANLEKQTADNRERIAAVGNEPAERELELRLRIEEATKNLLPAERERLAEQMRLADAATRELEARRQIAQATRQNDERARRIGAMGDPAAERRLALELEIERIRRSMPESTQEAAIANAMRGADLETDEARARARADREDRQRSLEQQLYLTQFIGTELAVQEAVQRRQEELRRTAPLLSEEQLQRELEIEEVYARQEARLRTQLQQRLAIRDAYLRAAEDIGEGFSKMFSYAFREGELKANFALRAIELAFYNMLDRIVQQLVVSPLIDLIGKLFGMVIGGIGGGGKIGSAPGAPLALGGVIPAANGMVVNTPTRLRGGSVLTGEGPGLYEAILPLKRGADGKLGVVSGGGGGGGGGAVVNVIDQRGSMNSEAIEIQERQTGDGMREVNIMIRDAVRSNIRSGAFDSDNRSVYGISRTITRR